MSGEFTAVTVPIPVEEEEEKTPIIPIFPVADAPVDAVVLVDKHTKETRKLPSSNPKTQSAAPSSAPPSEHSSSSAEVPIETDRATVETAQRKRMEFAASFDQLVTSNLKLTQEIKTLVEMGRRAILIAYVVLVVMLFMSTVMFTVTIWSLTR